MTLIYHDKTFKDLKIRPIISESNRKILKEREQLLGIKFPKSLFEFFSIEGVSELFRNRTNEDELISNAIFDEREKLKVFGKIEEIEHNFLMVAVENQGVICWFARLNGSEDPPIYHDNDTYCYEEFTNIAWFKCSDSFSEFIYEMLIYG